MPYFVGSSVASYLGAFSKLRKMAARFMSVRPDGVARIPLRGLARN